MDDSLALTSGLRLQSQVCQTNVIVIRPAARPITLCCGGKPMVPLHPGTLPSSVPEPAFANGSLLGKRYTHPDDDTLELLVTRAGTGSLSDGSLLLVIKETRPLPASD
jgi:hypothetical protein